MSRIAYEMHATVSEWTDQATGKRCRRTVQIGTVFEHESGRLSARLELVPVLPGWSGFVAFRPVLPPGRRMPPGMPDAPPIPDEQPAGPDPDDDIPF